MNPSKICSLGGLRPPRSHLYRLARRPSAASLALVPTPVALLTTKPKFKLAYTSLATRAAICAQRGALNRLYVLCALRSVRCIPCAALHALHSTHYAPHAALYMLRSTRCAPVPVLDELRSTRRSELTKSAQTSDIDASDQLHQQPKFGPISSTQVPALTSARYEKIKFLDFSRQGN